MPSKDPNVQNEIVGWLIVVIGTLFAMFGGATKHLSDSQENSQRPTWAGVAVNMVIGGFTGSIVSLYLVDQGFSAYLSIAGAGFSGFLGAVLLRLASKVFFHRVSGDANAYEKMTRPARSHSDKGE